MKDLIEFIWSLAIGLTMSVLVLYGLVWLVKTFWAMV